MAKRSGLRARNEAVQAAVQAQATRKRTPAAAQKKTPAATEGKSTDPGKRVGISIRMDADIHDELRRIAYEYRTSIQALVTQGIERVIGEHPPKKGA